VTSSYYEIRVTGVLPPEALVDFDRLTSSVEVAEVAEVAEVLEAPEAVQTVVHGPLQDQAALNGLLARLEVIGAEVIEVRRLREDGSSR
jgi:hypothetical protein